MLEIKDRNGSTAASGTGGCASAGKREAKWLGFGAETKSKTVCGPRYGADARGRTAGWKATVARRSRVQKKQARSRSRVSG